jgi:DNA-binding protein
VHLRVSVGSFSATYTDCLQTIKKTTLHLNKLYTLSLTKMSAENSENAIVRVSSNKRKFGYVDYAKHRLYEGYPEVTISALGTAIADAVSVVELLKNQGVVKVKKIRTARAQFDDVRSTTTDKIEVTLVKSADFDKIYEQQQKDREAAKAKAEADGEDDA